MIKPIVQRLALKSSIKTLSRVVPSLPQPLSPICASVCLSLCVYPPPPQPWLCFLLSFPLQFISFITIGLDRLQDNYLRSERKGDFRSTTPAGFLTKATSNKKVSTRTSKGLASVARGLVIFQAVAGFWPPFSLPITHCLQVKAKGSGMRPRVLPRPLCSQFLSLQLIHSSLLPN